MQLVINGEQEIKVNAAEAALILDSLAAQPYRTVAGLIGKITAQLKDNRPEEKPDAEPETERAA